MTTHDQHTELNPVEGTERPVERHDHSSEYAAPPAEHADRSTEYADPPAEYADSPAAVAEPPAHAAVTEPHADPPAVTANGSPEVAAPSTERELFADDELAGLRARWDNVQAGFVDDPRECVQKADSLVSDVVEHLTTGFTHARSRLEEQWARGEEASTEDLRVALKHYREFFQRLLSV